ncbi:MAG: sigma-70 family RNA polymerase sigma factor [Chloroflexales bacterium]|nr:sigma-70 family RNA polymerase sigma factor [Chloroflexales bacterium]
MNDYLVCLGAPYAYQAFRAEFSLEEIYERYRGPIFHYLYRLCGSAEQAEDLAQEAFTKACAGLASFRGDCSVSTWLFCIARNTYIDSTRRPGAARIDTDELLSIPDRDSACDPAHHYAALEQRDAINLALTQLPEKYRSVLLLRDQEGLSYAEIAAILEMSLAAVKVNLFRARNAFRTIYAEINQEHEGSAE